MIGIDYPEVCDPGPEGNPSEPPSDGYEILRRRLVDGGSFILDAPETVPAVWGEGGRVLWAEGEALVVAGPSGVGKTTIAGQLVRGLILGGHELLGLPVARRRRVLYLAMDRPRQAARALRRTLQDVPRAVLAERLVVWPGPPMADVARNPETLLALVEAAEADVVVVDSIKDATIGLSDDEVGAGYNRARQIVLTSGREVVELHHLVKRGAAGGPPTTLADLYGSVWITAGAGSVVMLWGEAGDPIVELRHLKQPAEDVGPFRVQHDHDAGCSSIWEATDLVSLAGRPEGITPRQAAMATHSTDKPSPAQVEKARRKLDRLAAVVDGAATAPGWIVEPGDKAEKRAAVYRRGDITGDITRVMSGEDSTPTSRDITESTKPQVRDITADITRTTAGQHHVSHTPLGVGNVMSLLCAACGEPLSGAREAYGKSTCVDCEQEVEQ